MSKKRLLTTFALFITAISLATACASQPPAPPPKPEETKQVVTEIRVASSLSETHPGYSSLKEALEQIAVGSQGKVKFTYFPSGTLVKSEDAYSAVLKGIADITIMQASYFAGDFPLTQVMSLEPGFPTETEAAANALFVKEFLLPEWSKAKMLTYLTPGSASLITAKKPVRGPEDLKGMRVFAVGLAAKYMAAMGSTPVSMSPTELYEAMQKGIVDGAVIGAVALQSIKLAEVAKYITVPGFGSVSSAAAMRKESYEALPADIRALLDKLADTVPPIIGKKSDAQSEKAFQLLKDKGGEVIRLDPQQRAAILKIAMKVNDEWATEMDAKGLAGTKILQDRYQFLKKYMPGVLP